MPLGLASWQLDHSKATRGLLNILRSAGPESIAIRRPDDWTALLERCLRHRADILANIMRQAIGTSSKPSFAAIDFLKAACISNQRVSFRQINKKTGNRLRQQLVDEVTREPVEGENKGRGYEYAKNAYIPVDDDELDAIAVESTHTIEIDSFVPREQIDERYLDSPYYIKPDDRVGQEAFAVIRDAMRSKGLVGLGRVVLAKRERPILLEPWDKGLTATTLRYPYEIRDAKEYFDDIPDVKVEPEMLKLAEQILQNKATDFDPSRFEDRYEGAVVAMIEKKQAGLPVSRERATPQPQNSINIMDVLRRSIAQEKAASVPPKKGRKRIEGQGEMLLPIQGKKGKQATAKSAERAPVRQKSAS